MMITTAHRLAAPMLLAMLAASPACADIAVIVSAKSAVSAMNKHEVAALYLGQTKTFPGGEVAITSIVASGATRDEFLAKVLEKTDAQTRATWSRLTFTGTGSAPRELKNSAETKQLIANNPNMIGIVDKAAVDATVRVVYEP